MLLVGGRHPVGQKGDVNIGLTNEESLHDLDLWPRLVEPLRRLRIRNRQHKCRDFYRREVGEGVRYRIG